MREHAVHWVVGGVLLSLTGFVPEEWVARTVHGLRMPDSILHLWSAGVDVRVVPIAIGVSVVAIALIWQRHASLLVVPAVRKSRAPVRLRHQLKVLRRRQDLSRSTLCGTCRKPTAA
jgi:hypothetical protein